MNQSHNVSSSTVRKSYKQPFLTAKRVIAGVAVFLIFLALAVAGLLVMTGHQHHNISAATLQVVAQPPTAAQVADSVNCDNFKDSPVKAGTGFGTVDAGSCYIDGAKYAINTFLNSSVRDSWLKLAEPLGVNPKWETATAVVYPSVSS
jgi:hypothetical protein